MSDSELVRDILAGILLAVTVLNVIALLWIAHSLKRIRTNLKRARESIDETNQINGKGGGH